MTTQTQVRMTATRPSRRAELRKRGPLPRGVNWSNTARPRGQTPPLQHMPWLLGVVQCFTGCLQTKAMTPLHHAARRVGLQLAPQRAVHPCGIGCLHGVNMAYVALKGGHVTAWAMCALPCPKCRSTRVVCACRVESSCNNNHSVVFLKCMPPICQFRAAKNAWHVCSTTCA